MIGLGCGESIGSSVVKRFGSPSGAGTNTRCGTFGSGNFGPPERGSFTISRFVMMCPRHARLVERRALKDRATGGSEQGRERVKQGPNRNRALAKVILHTDVPTVRRGRVGGRGYIYDFGADARE